MVEYIVVKSKNNYKISCKLWLPKSEMKEIVVACHGFAGDKESSAISLVASNLLEKNIGTIAFDLPGHGASEIDGDWLMIDHCLDDFEQIIEYIKNKYPRIKINIFATSFGAYLALLLIKKRNIDYQNIILRCPAIRMDKILLDEIIQENTELFQKQGYVIVGYERELKVNYSFYQELVSNQIMDFDFSVNPNILIIHGDADGTAPIEDSIAFCKRFNIPIKVIKGADHRFKKPGELEQVVECTMNFIEKNLI